MGLATEVTEVSGGGPELSISSGAAWKPGQSIKFHQNSSSTGSMRGAGGGRHHSFSSAV
ncbi:MAG: hypothetical protein QW842_05850 [Candidatus Nezhaarchaeales archaeon]